MRAKPVDLPPPIITLIDNQNTKGNLETKKNNSLIVSNVVLFAKKILNVFLRNGGTLRMKNFDSL